MKVCLNQTDLRIQRLKQLIHKIKSEYYHTLTQAEYTRQKAKNEQWNSAHYQTALSHVLHGQKTIQAYREQQENLVQEYEHQLVELIHQDLNTELEPYQKTNRLQQARQAFAEYTDSVHQYLMHQKIPHIAGLVLLICLLGFFTYTGYVAKESAPSYLTLDASYDSNTTIPLNLISLKSLRVNGRIVGKPGVQIYLEAENNQSQKTLRYLVLNGNLLELTLISGNVVRSNQGTMFVLTTDHEEYETGETIYVVLAPENSYYSLYLTDPDNDTTPIDGLNFTLQKEGRYQLVALITKNEVSERLETSFTVTAADADEGEKKDPTKTEEKHAGIYLIQNQCDQSCNLPENLVDPRMVIEMSAPSRVTLFNVSYTQHNLKQAPRQTLPIPDQTTYIGRSKIIDLNDYFKDDETLSFSTSTTELALHIKDGILTLRPNQTGNYTLFVYASDGNEVTTSNLFSATVKEPTLQTQLTLSCNGCKPLQTKSYTETRIELKITKPVDKKIKNFYLDLPLGWRVTEPKDGEVNVINEQYSRIEWKLKKETEVIEKNFYALSPTVQKKTEQPFALYVNDQIQRFDVVVQPLKLDVEQEKLDLLEQINTTQNVTVLAINQTQENYSVQLQIENVQIKLDNLYDLRELQDLTLNETHNVSLTDEVRETVTPILAVNSLNVSNATITLPLLGAIEAIGRCKDWNFESGTCSGEWEVLDIPFNETNGSLVFTVPGFSAYAGLGKGTVLYKIRAKHKKAPTFKAEDSPQISLTYQRLPETPLITKKTEGILQIGNEVIQARVMLQEEETELIPTIELNSDGTLNISLNNTRRFKPGRYTLNITLNQSGNIYETKTNFTWGVLAINTHKSIYAPNEIAQITMGVLNDQGKTVCEGLNLSLIVTDPDGLETAYTLAKGIQKGADCNKYIYTEIPDYASLYTVKGNGVYTLNLASQTENGEYSIQDTFLVNSDTAFDVSRSGPTRVWPFVKYRMRFTITPRQDYNGMLVEYVPLGFLITPQEGLIVTEENDALKLTWNKNLVTGESQTVEYEFDAPDVSPEFYLLGKMQIGSWTEHREWQIANDAEVTIDDSLLDATDEFQASPQVVFINDTRGYAFYSDTTGSGQISIAHTNNSGTTWGLLGQFPKACGGSNEVWSAPAVWYDWWTPGDTTGTKIHVASTGDAGDDLCYIYLDTNGDTQRSGGWIETTAAGAWVEAADGTPSITKATDGELYVLHVSSNTPDGFQVFNSSNGGDTWATTSVTGTYDNLDRGQLLPLDNGDIILIHQDASTNTMQSKVRYASNNSWDTAYATADSNWAESTTYDHQWAATLNKNTGDVYLAGTNAVAAATGDLRVIKYTSSTRTWGALTNPVDNIVMTQVAPAIDLNTGNIAVLFANGSAGATMHVYVKNSSDDGATWNTVAQLSSTGDDIKYLGTNMMSDERLYAIWYNDDLNDLLGNTIEDLISSEDGASVTTLNQSAFITLDNQTTDWENLTILADTTSETILGGPSFDLTNVSLSNGPTRLFAYIQLAGGLNFSANQYYRIFVTNNESKGKPTTPDTSTTLPFNYTRVIQLNNSKCRVFNNTGGKVGNCHYYNNSNTLEIEVSLKYLNVTKGESLNATFETGNWTHRFDFAPNNNSYIQFLINQTKYNIHNITNNTYENYTTDLVYPTNNSFSVELWMKTNASKDQVFISSGEYEDLQSWWKIGMQVGENTSLYVRIQDNQEDGNWWAIPDPSADQGQIYGQKPLDNNQWHHVTIVRDQEQKTISGYVDGKLDLNFTDATSSITDNATHLLLAESTLQYQENFDGQLVVIGVYNRALTPEEITEHYQTQDPEMGGGG